jgi:hypothetical protein
MRSIRPISLQKRQFSDEQIVGFLWQMESGRKPTAEVFREGAFHSRTPYVWKKKLVSLAEPELVEIFKRREG